MGSAWRGERRLASADSALSAGHARDAERLTKGLGGQTLQARAARLDAEAALQMGDVPAAARALVVALRTAPNDWSLHRDRAVLLQRLGDATAARSEMARALALNPKLVLPPGFTASRSNPR